ncbi:hypothetical protein [Flavobacterium silvaticum]|uniref:HEAT repeat domain-containing protein n=1 Tax=Flavobacterium silvaticum TaxID=1852020 RepID=A0A972FKY8_9FLAO|nr:hypothetical protein [Flavobacterium silvaticum]NMH27939.1 hypothetical protein [Flavobacterium silvaticum]
MKKQISFLFSIFWCLLCSAQDIQVTPKGVYAEINVEKDNAAGTALLGDDAVQKEKAAKQILEKPNDYNPGVLYALSDYLFSADKKDDATFWFYVAQLRARIDANICAEESAKQAVGVLNQTFGPTINEYAFKDKAKLETTVNRVVDFVMKNPENYDRRWINLYGMGAMMSGMEGAEKETQAPVLSHPKNEWNSIREKTIKDYYDGFVSFVKK